MKKVLIALSILTFTLTAYAAYYGKVEGRAYDYSDDSVWHCCSKIKYPSSAASELMENCRQMGGSYYANAQFVDSAYCARVPDSGFGWKYKCAKLVEAECH